MSEKKKIFESIKDTIESLKLQLDGLGESAREEVSTSSRAQDLLRAGYQTSCDAGIANLFGLKDVTIEACSEFLPRHKEEVEKWVDKNKKVVEEYFKTYAERMMHIELNNTYEKFPEWWKKPYEVLYNLWTLPGKKMYIKEKIFPTPEIIDVEISDPDFDTLDGVITSKVKIICTPHKCYERRPTLEDSFLNNGYKWPEFKYETYGKDVSTPAKRGKVSYESFDTYSNKFIPDEVIELVKEAKEIGIENVQVAYPSIIDGKNVENPKIRPAKRDPIVVGYLSRGEKRQSEMYIIAWFDYKKPDYNKEQPVACMY